ncbi:hypothetical protein ACM7TH_21785, partial [Enterobacter hormaechei]
LCAFFRDLDGKLSEFNGEVLHSQGEFLHIICNAPRLIHGDGIPVHLHQVLYSSAPVFKSGDCLFCVLYRFQERGGRSLTPRLINKLQGW